MSEFSYRLKMEKINRENRGFKVVLKDSMDPGQGIHIKTGGNTMRASHVGFRDDGALEISSLLHCAISEFTVFIDGIPNYSPLIIEGADDVEPVKKVTTRSRSKSKVRPSSSSSKKGKKTSKKLSKKASSTKPVA
ncbi:MAG: hypothetical protein AB7G75_35105 [Candidatus Binatia bacterium]